MEAVCDVVVGYLPAMEREREGQEAEDGDWMDKRKRRQWQAARELPVPLVPPPTAEELAEDVEEDGVDRDKARE